MTRLAVVTTHPVQYYAPWFRQMTSQSGLDVRVFYLWDFGVTRQQDPGFGQAVCWDLPLLEGYAWEFVDNRSSRPGTTHFWGIDNPQLVSRLEAYAPDVVLCIGYNYATFARLLWQWNSRRCPLLLRGDSHRLLPRRGLKEGLKRLLLSGLFRRFGAFLYVGQANRAYYRLHGVPEERLFFSPHAVDNDRFMANTDEVRTQAMAWKRELGIPPDRRVVLFVGKLEVKKRPQDLLAAFALARLPDTALLFVGAGGLEAELRAAARSVPQVYFAPFQNQTQMPRTYAAADVVVLPSYGPSETWGLCINEAMCLGKPVIVSSHVGCAGDLVEAGRNGAVFQAGDRADLARQLARLLLEEDLASAGRASLLRIQHYSYLQATEGLLNALAWLLGGQRGKRSDDRPTASRGMTDLLVSKAETR